jgi:hypothetical protein
MSTLYDPRLKRRRRRGRVLLRATATAAGLASAAAYSACDGPMPFHPGVVAPDLGPNMALPGVVPHVPDDAFVGGGIGPPDGLFPGVRINDDALSPPPSDGGTPPAVPDGSVCVPGFFPGVIVNGRDLGGFPGVVVNCPPGDAGPPEPGLDGFLPGVVIKPDAGG